MSKLSTHVLDLAAGRPANGMAVELLVVEAGGARVLKRLNTNVDGRTAQPLLEGESLVRGRYILRFHVAEYFRAAGHSLPEPPFLDAVDLAFGIADAGSSYHVPLLVTPWSYSTYRGS
jgi:5-hydroxyisourate hydrolase